MKIKSLFVALVLTLSIISSPLQVTAQSVSLDSFAGMNEAEIRAVLIDLITNLLAGLHQEQPNPTAVIATNKGSIELELFADTMPVTVKNFIALAEQDFYDNSKFHRVIENFMIQGGDPWSADDALQDRWGRGGPGYTIDDEYIEGPLLTNVRGTIAMANTGAPNSSGSQFFINLVDNTFLDFDKNPLASKHAVFGRVTAGMDIVDTIGSVETTAQDRPLEPMIVESITIKQ